VSTHKRALLVTTVPITLQAFLLPLADALRAKGWEVDALTGLTDDRVLAGDTEVLEQHFDAIHTIAWSRSATSLLRLGQLSRQIRALVKQAGYDVVHVHTPIAAFITRFALRHMPTRRIIYTVHGFHFMDDQPPALSTTLFKIAERCALYWTDDIVVMNDMDEAAGRSLVARTQKTARPCTLHRIDGTGLDFQDYERHSPVSFDEQPNWRPGAPSPAPSATPATLPFDNSTFVVGMVAEMNENKRHDVVIEAARTLAVSTDAIRFVFIGSGPLEERLKQKVGAYGLKDSIHFTGQLPHDEVRRLIALCDLGILVSQREGLPRSLMEFIASSVPVIGTDTRGIVDEVRNPSAICRPTPAALATLIHHYAKNPDELSALATEQYTHAIAHYDSDVVIPQYLKLYSYA